MNGLQLVDCFLAGCSPLYPFTMPRYATPNRVIGVRVEHLLVARGCDSNQVICCFACVAVTLDQACSRSVQSIEVD
jgi:hypothetical protein